MPTTLSPDLGAKTWSERFKIAERFAEIDFGCDFQDGKCARTRAERNREGLRYTPPVLTGDREERACCEYCAYSYGYWIGVRGEGGPFDELPFADFLESRYDKVLGFWREGVGCILPHKYRSTICLTYRCSVADDNAPRSFLHAWLRDVESLRFLTTTQ